MATAGIGSRLVEAMLTWMREWRYRDLVLETKAGLAAAIALYHRHGFAEVTLSILGKWELVWMRRPVGSGDSGK